MIISHKYKYLFVELPLTASTAVSKELRENYDGESILYKHATYHEFLKIASPEEKQYFVFSGMRNPLDQAVSHYFKFLTDYKDQFSDNQKFQRRGIHKLAYDFSHMNRYRFIQDSEADFSTFFLKFYKAPYNNWSSLAHDKFDFILRFENLAGDFAKLLEVMRIEPKRPLPSKNRTAAREQDFLSYYDTPELINRAKWVFGPYMKKWGYAFPEAWGDSSISPLQQLEFQFLDIFRNLYWRYIRRPFYRPSKPASTRHNKEGMYFQDKNVK